MQHSFFHHGNVQIQQKLTFDFKKPSFTWLLAAMLVELIMTETDIECGNTKTTLHDRGDNKISKIIVFSCLNSTNFNNNFKDNFTRENVMLTLVVLILSFASFVLFHHLYVWNPSQISF